MTGKPTLLVPGSEPRLDSSGMVPLCGPLSIGPSRILQRVRSETGGASKADVVGTKILICPKCRPRLSRPFVGMRAISKMRMRYRLPSVQRDAACV
jgi:hypothetical protein